MRSKKITMFTVWRVVFDKNNLVVFHSFLIIVRVKLQDIFVL